jgi:hypothetical protein
MLLEIVNRILIVLFFMSCLITIRHGYFFIQAIITSSSEEPIKYRLSSTSLFFLCVSIAYILSVIFTGITI